MAGCDLDTTLGNLRLGFQVIDVEWRYVYVNPAAAAHARRRVAELIGRTMMEMYPGIEHTALFERLCRSMDQRAYQVFDNLFTFRDGDSRWFDIRVEPVPEGICVYSLDIHNRKLAEVALQTEVAALRARAGLGERVRNISIR